MKIALLEPLNVSEEMLREMAAPVLERGHELTVYDTKADSPQEVIRRAQGMDAVIIANTPFPAEAVTENPALKYIDVAFTGVDHVPMEACRARGVLVSNAANYSNQSVAELTVGMAIALLRRLPDCDAAVRAHQGSAGLIGREIAERTVGIVGLGLMGGSFARALHQGGQTTEFFHIGLGGVQLTAQGQGDGHDHHPAVVVQFHSGDHAGLHG